MIIGITGGSGSGKTTALRALESLGAVVLDCDAIYHRLLETDQELLAAIDSRFPGTVVNGVLARKKLGEIVFANKADLEDLNKITHSAVTAEISKFLNPATPLIAIDAIGLFESGLNNLCDVTVAVIAPLEDRINRLMARDGISKEYALSRIHAQPSDEAFSKKCDLVLENSTTQREFYDKCLAFFRQWGIMKENQ